MDKPRLDQLEPPPDAREKGGHEVLRCFVVDGGLSISLRRAFDNAQTWGVLLADLARHAARVYAMETGVSEEEALEDIKRMFDAEWSHSADFSATATRN